MANANSSTHPCVILGYESADDDPPPKVRVPIAPEGCPQAARLHRGIMRRVARASKLAALDNDELVATALLDNYENVLAVELANRLYWLSERLIAEGIDLEAIED